MSSDAKSNATFKSIDYSLELVRINNSTTSFDTSSPTSSGSTSSAPSLPSVFHRSLRHDPFSLQKKLLEDLLQSLNSFPVSSKPFMRTFECIEDQFENPEGVKRFENGHDFMNHLETCPFNGVYHVENSDGLEMKVPSLTYHHLARLCDMHRERRVMVDNGAELKTLTWLFNVMKRKTNRKHIVNLLSFDFSQEKLADHFQLPLFVRRDSMHLLLKEKLKALREKTFHDSIPAYDYFLVVTTKGAFTNVHYDYSGMCNFFHVIKGRKVFYVAPPTADNLKALRDFNEHGSAGFFPSEHIEQFTRVSIGPGETMFMSPGYLHFVWTPEDTLAQMGGWISKSQLDVQFDITVSDKVDLMCDAIYKEQTCPEFMTVVLGYYRHVYESELEAASKSGQLAKHLPILQNLIDGINHPALFRENTSFFSLEDKVSILNSLNAFKREAQKSRSKYSKRLRLMVNGV